MDEQVKYTADDYELAESIVDCPKNAESLAQTFADIRQQGRAEAQQAAVCKRDHWTVESSSLLAVAEKLARLIPPHVATVREFEEHSNDSGDPVGGCGKCLELFERLLKEATELESAWKEAAGK